MRTVQKQQGLVGAQRRTEALVVVSRFVGELAKFRLLPFGSFFSLLKARAACAHPPARCWGCCCHAMACTRSVQGLAELQQCVHRARPSRTGFPQAAPPLRPLRTPQVPCRGRLTS